MRGDLHVHTSISDGSLNTEETLKLAKKNGVTHLGITNHDTVKGLKEAIELGNEMGIKVIPGIEISAFDYKNNRKVHILGYNFNLKAENINQLCRPILKARNANSLWQYKALLNEGYDIDFELLKEKSKDSEAIYKQHLMKCLIETNYTDKIYSELYRRLFKNRGACERDIEYVSVFDAIDAIKKDRGLAVLAHPGQLNSYDIIPGLLAKGLDGIELIHPSHSEEDIKRIKKIADFNGLILTGGSDFHGEYSESKTDIGELEAPEEFLELF